MNQTEYISVESLCLAMGVHPKVFQNAQTLCAPVPGKTVIERKHYFEYQDAISYIGRIAPARLTPEFLEKTRELTVTNKY